VSSYRHLTDAEVVLVRKLREDTGCNLMDAKKALLHADGDYDVMKEYIERTGLAVAFRGTPEEQKARRYPLWAARKAGRK